MFDTKQTEKIIVNKLFHQYKEQEITVYYLNANWYCSTENYIVKRINIILTPPNTRFSPVEDPATGLPLDCTTLGSLTDC